MHERRPGTSRASILEPRHLTSSFPFHPSPHLPPLDRSPPPSLPFPWFDGDDEDAPRTSCQISSRTPEPSRRRRTICDLRLVSVHVGRGGSLLQWVVAISAAAFSHRRGARHNRPHSPTHQSTNAHFSHYLGLCHPFRSDEQPTAPNCLYLRTRPYHQSSALLIHPPDSSDPLDSIAEVLDSKFLWCLLSLFCDDQLGSLQKKIDIRKGIPCLTRTLSRLFSCKFCRLYASVLYLSVSCFGLLSSQNFEHTTSR